MMGYDGVHTGMMMGDSMTGGGCASGHCGMPISGGMPIPGGMSVSGSEVMTYDSLGDSTLMPAMPAPNAAGSSTSGHFNSTIQPPAAPGVKP
jgi:hypothetical protein